VGKKKQTKTVIDRGNKSSVNHRVIVGTSKGRSKWPRTKEGQGVAHTTTPGLHGRTHEKKKSAHVAKGKLKYIGGELTNSSIPKERG